MIKEFTSTDQAVASRPDCNSFIEDSLITIINKIDNGWEGMGILVIKLLPFYWTTSMYNKIFLFMEWLMA
jgi:hypothetical protein